MAQTIKNYLQCGRPWFNPWVRKIPWRRAWEPTPVFLTGEFMDRGAWQAVVHGVAKGRTRLKRLSAYTHALPGHKPTEAGSLCWHGGRRGERTQPQASWRSVPRQGPTGGFLHLFSPTAPEQPAKSGLLVSLTPLSIFFCLSPRWAASP